MSYSSISKSTSLKLGQLKAVYRMLSFNQDTGDIDALCSGLDDDNYDLDDDGSGVPSIPAAGSAHNQWKILIYDTNCRSIISPLLSVSQLRRRGVTLHLLINSERESIPDVPAVYFVSPTKENLSIIAQDCAKRLYGRCYINFVTKLDRSLMEEFASLVVQSGSLDAIAGVHDQYLDYVCLEKRLFTLNKANSYVTYNGVGATESMIESFMTSIAYGLFSVIATQGAIPIIRCPKGGAPEMVARKLNRMIIEHPTLLRNKKANSAGKSRPLLVLLDRNADLITPCQHTSTYQALIDDVLDHKVNRVDFDIVTDANKDDNKKKPVKKQHKRFDLDPDKDKFYYQHKFQPFPEAIESNSVELQEVTDREQEIRSKATTQGGGGGAGGSSNTNDPLFNPNGGSGTDSLANAVDSLPALLDRKKQLEMHTSILQAVMNEVAARDIPPFFELESSLATGSYKNDLQTAKSEVLQILTDPTKGTIQDKVRLTLVYCLTTKATSSDLDEIATAMEQAIEVDNENAGGKRKNVNATKNEQAMKSIQYIRQLRSMHMISVQDAVEMDSGSSTAGGYTSAATSGLSTLMSRATSQATGLLAKASDRVSSILGKQHKHYATRVIENLYEMKNGTEDDDYLYLDPKVKGDIDIYKLKNSSSSGMSAGGMVGAVGAAASPSVVGGGSNLASRRAPVKEVICFVIGGGCYAEYQNLQMLVQNENDTSMVGSSSTRQLSTSSSTSGGRSITYGSTEILDAEAFVSQLGQLG